VIAGRGGQVACLPLFAVDLLLGLIDHLLRGLPIYGLQQLAPDTGQIKPPPQKKRPLPLFYMVFLGMCTRKSGKTRKHIFRGTCTTSPPPHLLAAGWCWWLWPVDRCGMSWGRIESCPAAQLEDALRGVGATVPPNRRQNSTSTSFLVSRQLVAGAGGCGCGLWPVDVLAVEE
jgi:hypothetical protein